ncbi:AAA family ATPase [Nocardia sp. X0981]
MISAYSLSRKQGWFRFVDTVPRVRPDTPTRAMLAALSEDARADFDDTRHDWHANFGTLATPQLRTIRDELGLIVASNRQDPDRVRGAAVIDGLPGLGKTTIVNLFGREYHRSAIRRHGELTDEGHEHIPVFRVGLSSNTTLRTLNKMICQFYGHPGSDRGSAAALAANALDCVLSCGTRVGIIDDIHFINQNSRDGLAVSNHLKWLANELPVTFIYAGVGLGERRFFDEGPSGASAALAQTARRWTRFEVGSFDRDRHWRSMVHTIDGRLVLADHAPGRLDEIGDYLFARTGGHIGSLMTLITRGCYRAITTGSEALTIGLLDTLRIDEASEKARLQPKPTLTTTGRGQR